MTWNHRVCVHRVPDGQGADEMADLFDIREVYYDEDGWADGWSENPPPISGDTVVEVMYLASLMSAASPLWVVDLDSYERGVTPVEEFHHKTGQRRRAQAGPRSKR